MSRVLLLLLAAGAWAWWLGPQQQHPLGEPLLLGGALRLDTLRLLFLTLFLAVPAPDPTPGPLDPPRRRLQPRLASIALAVCRLGLVLVTLATTTGMQIVGLVVAGVGLALAAWPLGWGRTLTPLILLPIAVLGTFDGVPAPGAPVPILPWALIGLALLAASAGSGAWPFAGPVPATPDDPRPAGGARGAWMAALYGAGSLLPLIYSLQAGAWDAWARLLALAAGLLTLATAACAALGAPNSPASARAARHYLAGALYVGLGLGSAPAVAGGLALLLVGLTGIALTATPGIPRLVGLAALGGLPPTLGFCGLWLLLGAAAGPATLLPAVAVPVVALITVLVRLRFPPEPGLGAVAAWIGAAGLLVGGALPGAFLDGALRPALQSLAAGVPALGDVQALPGVGLLLVHGGTPIAVWPAAGLAAALLLTLALAEGAARLLARRPPPLPAGPEALPAAVVPAAALVPAAATWARWLDPASLVWAAWLRAAGRPGGA